MLQGVIFDFDGTLFDSMLIWETAGEIYLRSIGKEPQEALQQVLKPMSLYQSAVYLQQQYDIPMSAAEIIDGINRTVEDFYLHTTEPKPGVRAWLADLTAKGIRMCIATATDRGHVDAALTRCGMRQYFSEILTCTEVGCGKDQPLIFRKAMEHLETNRRNTVVVEDAFHAVQTAKSDGFLTVAVCDSYESQQERLRVMADVYLPDYTDLTSFWKLASAE